MKTVINKNSSRFISIITTLALLVGMFGAYSFAPLRAGAAECVFYVDENDVTQTHGDTIIDNKTLINDDTLTDNGTIIDNETLINDDILTDNGTIIDNEALINDDILISSDTIIDNDNGATHLETGEITTREREVVAGITPLATSQVTYIDAEGIQQTVSARTFRGGSAALTDGWHYLYTGYWWITSDFRVTVSGHARIILSDGMRWYAHQGIHVPPGSSLTIYGQAAGTGRLLGNRRYNQLSGNAGIGGNSDQASGNITINGGIVEVTGSRYAAGIGGGNFGNGGTITINRGTVIATGGHRGAGIGSGVHGAWGHGGNITINGGTVTATGGTDSAGIGGGLAAGGGTITINGGTVTATGNNGAGIGGGFDGNGGTINVHGGFVTANGTAGVGRGRVNPGGNNPSTGTLNMNGDGILVAQSIDATQGGVTNGILYIGNNGTLHGNVTLVENISLPAGRRLTIPAGRSLTIPNARVLTNNGTINNYGTITINSGGRLVNNGTIDNRNVIHNDGTIDGPILGIPPEGTPPTPLENLIDLSDPNHVGAGLGFTFTNDIFTINNNANVIVRGSNAGGGGRYRRIEVAQNANATILLDGADVRAGANLSSITLHSGANLTVNLAANSTNILRGGSRRAAIHVPVGTTLTINGPGTLTANGGQWSAGIGGGNAGDVDASAGNINIHGGTITVNGGGWGGAGIGGGGGTWHTPAGNGGTVTITGGIVNVTAHGGGAGIGGGRGREGSGGTDEHVQGGAGGTTIISGGTVTISIRDFADDHDIGAGIGGGGGHRPRHGAPGVGGTTLIYGENTVVTVQSNGGAQDIGHGYGSGDAVPGNVIAVLPQGNLRGRNNAIIGNNVSFTSNPAATGSTVRAAFPAPFNRTETIFTGDFGTGGGARNMSFFTNLAGGSQFSFTLDGGAAITRTANQLNAANASVAFAPAITINRSGTHTFTAATFGYGAQTPLPVTITNTGTAWAALTVALSGTNSGSFELSSTSISIGPDGSADFTVVPRTGLAVGTHTATVTVSGTNVTSQTFNVSFTVNVAPITSAAITVIAPATGNAPVTTATGTGNFSLSGVTWTPNRNPFQANAAYTARVTLTANTGHTFTGITNANVTINSAQATIVGTPGSTLVIERTFGNTTPLTLTATHFTLSNNNRTFNNSAQGATVVFNGPNATTAGAITVRYEGIGGTSYPINTTAPTNAGTYRVLVSTPGGTLYGAASNINVGTLTISRLGVSGGTVGAFAAMTYSGNPQTPSATVTVNNLTAIGGWSQVTNVGSTTTFTATGNFTGTITRDNPMAARTLTVTPNSNQQKFYGAADPVLTFTHSGQVSDQVPGFTGALSRAQGDEIGNYAINIGTLTLANGTGGFLAANYTLSFTTGRTFAVVQADIPQFATLNTPNGNNNWFVSGDVILTAPDGFQISTSNALTGNTWTNSLTLDNSDGGNKSANYFLRRTSDGAISASKTIHYNVDTTAPSQPFIDITKINDGHFARFMNFITFGAFFNEGFRVTITTSDALSGVTSITYNIGGGPQTVDTTGSHSFDISADFRGEITAFSTDNAGNTSATSTSMGVINEADAPIITVTNRTAFVGWLTADTNMNVAVNDAGSGIYRITYTIGNNSPITAFQAVAGTELTANRGFNIPITANGQYNVVIAVFDNSGNTSQETVAVKMDQTTPTISVSGDTVNYRQSDTVTITPSAPTSGIEKVEVQKDSGAWTDITSTYTGGYTVTANGTYTFRVTNGAGLTQTASITYNNIDTTRPVVAIDSGSYTDGEWTNENVTLSVGNTAANLGTTTFQYSTDAGQNWHPYTGAITVSAEGTVTYSFMATSESGMVSEVEAITVMIDKTVPSQPAIDITKINDGDFARFMNFITFGAFSNQGFRVNITSSDALSGVASITYDIGGGPQTVGTTGSHSFNVTTDFTGNITAFSTDNTGNISDPATSTGIINEADDPVIKVTNEAAFAGWLTADTNMNVEVSDVGSGINRITYTIGSNGPVAAFQAVADVALTENHSFDIPITADGEYNVVINVTDNSGNTSQETVAVKMDQTTPYISVSGDTVNYRQSDTVTITASAAISGIEKVEVQKDSGDWTDITSTFTTGYTVTANGTYTFRVTNIAGTSATASITYNNIDTTRPVVVINSQGYVGGAWTNESVTLSVSSTAANLGTTAFQYSTDGATWHNYTGGITVSDEGTVTYSFRATSESGVVSDIEEITVMIDKTAPSQPVITLTRINDGDFARFMNFITFGAFFNQGFRVTITTNDALSGVASITYNIGGGLQIVDTADSHSFNVTTDFMGNITAFSTDNTGNDSITATSTGIINEADDPVINVTNKDDFDDWLTSDTNMNVAVNDAGSGIYRITYTIGSNSPVTAFQAVADVALTKSHSFDIPITADGEYNVVINVTDNSGNTSQETVAVKMDQTTPYISVSGDTVNYRQSDTVTITASAPISGIAKVEVQKSDGQWNNITATVADGYTVTANGTYTFRATNVAGTSATASITYTNIDTTRPVVAINSQGYVGGAWTNESVTLSVSNTTANLGTTIFQYSTDGTTWHDYTAPITVSDEGTVTYSFKATNESGLVSEVESITVMIDTTAPTAEVQYRTNGLRSFLNTITFGLFFRDTVSVTIQSDDNLSGVAFVEYYIADSVTDPQTITGWMEGASLNVTPGGLHILYVRITDNAGNVSTFHEGVVIFNDSEDASGSFLKGPDDDLTIDIVMNGNTVRQITRDEAPAETVSFTSGTDQITFGNAYLRGLDDGIHDFTVTWSPPGETGNPHVDSDTLETTKIIINVSRSQQRALSIVGLNNAYTYGDAPFNLSYSGGSGTGEVTFTSSNDAVASVNGTEVTIHQAGTFTITATKAGDARYFERSVTSETVTASMATPTPEPPTPTPTLQPTPDPTPTSFEGRKPMPADDLSSETILAAIRSDVPVVIVLSEGASTDISGDTLQLIRENEELVYIELPSGIILRIDPATITDNAIAADLNITIIFAYSATYARIGGKYVPIPANTIIIKPPTHGEFGFEISIIITAEQLEKTGLQGYSFRKYHVGEGNGIPEPNIAITEKGRPQRSSDNTVVLTIGHASAFLLRETSLLDAMAEMDTEDATVATPETPPEAPPEAAVPEPETGADVPVTAPEEARGGNALGWIIGAIIAALALGGVGLAIFLIRRRSA